MLCVALPLASLILGFLQMGAAQDSFLNPFPEWAPAMGGVFANPNHQGTAMLIGLAVCLAFAVDGFRPGMDVPRSPWPAVIAGGTLLLALPLTNSRAAVLIGVLMVGGAPLAMGATARWRAREARRSLLLLISGAAVGVIGLVLAMGWMRVDELEGARSIIRHATFDLAAQHLPWGSGVGSFVPVFEQALPDALLLPSYINAAHDDYAQVWLEAGISGLLVAAVVALVLGRAMRDHFLGQVGDRRLVWSAVLGLAVFLAHSVVDYPLRTPALMAIAALLAGTLIAQATRSR
jgi:O-antigen ligase